MASATGTPEVAPARESVQDSPSETEPLLGKPGDAVLPAGASIIRGWFLGTGILAEIGVILLCVNIWARIAMSPVILFSGHPIAMSIGLFFLIQSILTLQPTTTPYQKRIGQYVHAGLNFFSFASLVSGAVIIEVNKVRGNGPHFHSIHAYFGVITLLIMLVQYFVGFTMLFIPGLYGGVEHAKSLYKYHRYAGYLILILILVTVCAAMETPYVKNVLVINTWGVILASVVIVLGVFPRIQKQKLGFGVQRRRAINGTGDAA